MKSTALFAISFWLLLWPVCKSAISDPESEKFHKVGGGEYQLPAREQVKATAVIFFGHDCPMSNGYAPEINRLCKEFQPQGIAFCIVYADSDLNAVEAEKHAKAYGLECPAILDPELKLATWLGAKIKPEVAVISADHALLYRGRIDNRYVDFGKQRLEPTSRELRAAFESIVNGQAISVSRSKALGCDIYFPKRQNLSCSTFGS